MKSEMPAQAVTCKSRLRATSALIGSLFWLLAPMTATAASGQLDREYQAAPLLGSGNAGQSDASGIDSLFYNPANLARARKVIGEIVVASPHIEASENGINLYKDIKANKNMLDIVSNSIGRPVSLGVQNVTGASFRRTAFALFQRVDLDVAVKNDVLSGIPTASARSSVRAGLALGFGRSFASNALHLGVTGLVVQKAAAELSVSALDAQTKLGGAGGDSVFKDALKRGVAVGAHAGLLYTPKASSDPELSLVARNIGMTYSVGGKAADERPSGELQTLDFGLSLQPGTRNSRSRLSLDVRDVLNKSKENIYKRIHLGAEVNFSDVLGVLGGLNQGYTTYGVYINSKIVRLDAGIFSKELGKYPGDSKSRNYYGRVSVGWIQ